MNFAYWRKCDFQVHTPRDPNWQGVRPVGLGDIYQGVEATLSDVEAARAAWARDFVDHCVRRELEAVAITDHHEMVMLPYVRAEIADRKGRDTEFDLWLFPGMELTCRGGVQCLIIFDVDLSSEWLSTAQARLGIVAASLNATARQGPRVTQLNCHYPDIIENLANLEELRGKFIVLPNVSQGGQHTVLTNGAHADFKRMTYVGGYLDNGQNIALINGTNRRRLSGEEPQWGTRYIYPLPTSDARSADYSQLGKNHCWIKLAAPTAEAIRQAFLGHKSRISTERPSVTNLAIKTITISGSAILSSNEIALSPELNCFIGGRGSGKSTLLEYIAFGLGRSCSDIEKQGYSGCDRLAAVIKDTLVAPGATLNIEVIQDGATFNISRSGASSYNPKVTYPDGTSQELSLKELRSLFPAVVYSQGELSEIGKQAGKGAQLTDLLQFVDPEFKREDERLNNEIDSSKLVVRKAVQNLAEAWNQEAQLHKLETARSSLEQRIKALQKTLPELPEEDRLHVARYDSLADLDNKRQLAEKQTQSVMNDLAELWRTSRQQVDLSSDLAEASEIQSAYTEFNASFASGVETLGKALKVHHDKVESAGRNILAALSAAKADRDKVMEKLTEHRSVTLQITKLQEELHTLISQIGDLAARCFSTNDKFSELQDAISSLKAVVALRATKTKEWANKIELLSSRRIEAHLKDDHNWSEIFEAIDTLVAKTGSQAETRYQRSSERLIQDGPWHFLDAIRSDCLSALRWKHISSSGGSEKPKCSTFSVAIGATDKVLTNFIELIDVARVEAIAVAVPKPEITLFYCDGDRKIEFEKASEGQRAAALLFMLLEQNGGPLIVDQPEGDLDNKIVSELAEKLHTAKQRRQIFFASHNANIVVNGSSELVLGMEVTADAKRTVGCCGAIDRDHVCKKITETMEGGEKAFRERKEKYGY